MRSKTKNGSSIYAGVEVRIVEHVVSQVAYYVATDSDSVPSSDIESEIDEGKTVSEKERFVNVLPVEILVLLDLSFTLSLIYSFFNYAFQDTMVY